MVIFICIVIVVAITLIINETNLLMTNKLMTNFKNYFSFRYTELLVPLKYASRHVHLLVANPLREKCH